MAALSDQGSRDYNEDAAVVLKGHTQHILSVCDGMGGHAAGEVASGLAIEVFKGLFKEDVEDHDPDPSTFLTHAINLANSTIRQDARENPSREGMGSTCVVGLIRGNKLSMGHVGDSRGYLVRGGAIRQLTRDHSFVEEMVRAGMITPHETYSNPQRNVILQSLGCNDKIKIEVSPDTVTLKSGDYILLCSDGLTAVVADQEIAEIVERLADPQKICQELVDLTNRRGAPDNVTVALGRFEGELAEGPLVSILCEDEQARDLYRLILPRGDYRPEFHACNTLDFDFPSGPLPKIIVIDHSEDANIALDLCRDLRTNTSYGRIPIVLVSDGTITPQKGRAAGASVVIHTQALLGSLIATLNKVLEASTGRVCVFAEDPVEAQDLVRSMKASGFAVRVYDQPDDLYKSCAQRAPHAVLLHVANKRRVEPVCRKLRSTPGMTSCPLVLTAEGAASDPTQAFLIGADYYLPRHEDVANLVQMLSRA